MVRSYIFAHDGRTGLSLTPNFGLSIDQGGRINRIRQSRDLYPQVFRHHGRLSEHLRQRSVGRSNFALVEFRIHRPGKPQASTMETERAWLLGGSYASAEFYFEDLGYLFLDPTRRFGAVLVSFQKASILFGVPHF